MSETIRGQTTLDFVIGLSVFLLALGFAFGFLPGVFAPFSVDSDAELMRADRSAVRLSERILGSPTRPNRLNSTCTAAFFEGATLHPGCRYETLDLTGALGLPSRTNVNVTVEREGDVASVDGVRLARGPVPSRTSDVGVARRLVILEGATYNLIVRVW